MLQQWHTPAPVIKPAQRVDFRRFRDSDRVYQLATTAELNRLGEFIDELEVAQYIPRRSYAELKRMMNEPPMFATHVQLFVMTATMGELRREGAVGRENVPRSSVIYPSTNSAFTVANEPCATVPRYFPQLSYGIESIITPEWVRAYHRCCKLDVDHPGCWHGPVKYVTDTPWGIVASNFADLETRESIILGLRVPIVKGSYWRKDPTPDIVKLRRELENEIVGMILEGRSPTMRYFELMDLTLNKTVFDGVRGTVAIATEEQMPPRPASPRSPASLRDQYYLDIMVRRDEFIALKADIDTMTALYKGLLITPSMTAVSADIADLSPQMGEERLSSILDFDATRLNVLKASANAPIADKDLLKKAQVLNLPYIVGLLALKARVTSAASVLNVTALLINVPDIEPEFVRYVQNAQNTVPLPSGTALSENVLFGVAYEYFLTGIVNVPPDVPKEVAISPYMGMHGMFPYSTGAQFEWFQDSCWCDAVITALFSIPASPWEIEIRRSTKMHVRDTCNATDFRDAIMKDIEYLQREPGVGQRSKSIPFFEKCAVVPQRLGRLEVAADTFTNLKALFDLSDSVVLRDEIGDKDPLYTTFAVIVSRPGHFVPYILQPDGRYIRLDNLAHPTERVLYFDAVREGGLRMLNRDDPTSIYEFNERINFYLDMRTDLWERMTKFTAKDMFEHWKSIRDRLRLIQPVYLNDDQKRIKANQNGPRAKAIPSHNKSFYDDADTFVAAVETIKTGQFDYMRYPDGIGGASGAIFKEPLAFTASLNELVGAFNGLKVSTDPHDIVSYFRLLMLAVKPKYESKVLYDESGQNPTLVATDTIQSYVHDDEGEMMSILNYFFGAPMRGQVMDV
jgi:hypothetical protein